MCNEINFCISYIGVCWLLALEQYDRASEFLPIFVERYDREIQSFSDTYSDIHDTIKIMLGNILFKMEQYENAMNILQLSRSICLSMNEHFFERNAFIFYSGVGACLVELNQFEEALKYLNMAIQNLEEEDVKIINQIPVDYLVVILFNVALTYHNLGKCYIHVRKYEEVLYDLLTSLKIVTKGNMDKANDEALILQLETYPFLKSKVKDLESVLFDIGLLLMQQNCFKEAISYFERSMMFHNKISAGTENKAVVGLLTCYMEIYNRERVENYFKDVRKARKITSIYETDSQKTYSVVLSKSEPTK